MRLAWRIPTAAAALAFGAAAASLTGAVMQAHRASLPPVLGRFETEGRAPAAAPTSLASIVERNPFRLSLEDAAPVPVAEAAPAPDRLRLKLIGVAVAGARSRALLRDVGAGRSDLYRIGDPVGDERLAEVYAGYVILEGSGGRRPLELGVEPPPPGAPPVPSPAASVDGDARVLSRKELFAAIGGRGRVDSVLGQTRLLPRFVDGRIAGFRVEDVAAESFLGEMGIRGGDVILRVNGQNLDSHERGLALWQDLKEAGEVVLEINRGGAPETLRYRFTQ